MELILRGQHFFRTDDGDALSSPPPLSTAIWPTSCKKILHSWDNHQWMSVGSDYHYYYMSHAVIFTALTGRYCDRTRVRASSDVVLSPASQCGAESTQHFGRNIGVAPLSSVGHRGPSDDRQGRVSTSLPGYQKTIFTFTLPESPWLLSFPLTEMPCSCLFQSSWDAKQVCSTC